MVSIFNNYYFILVYTSYDRGALFSYMFQDGDVSTSSVTKLEVVSWCQFLPLFFQKKLMKELL